MIGSETMLARIERADALARKRLSEEQRHALGCWHDVVTKGGAFTRAEIRPERLGRVMSVGSRFLRRAHPGGGRPDYVHARDGDIVERFFGRSEGQFFRDCYTPTYLLSVVPYYDAAIDTCCPDFIVAATESPGGRIDTFSQLILPLEDVSGILSVFDFRLPVAAFPAGPLGLHLPLQRAQNTARHEALPRSSLGYRVPGAPRLAALRRR